MSVKDKMNFMSLGMLICGTLVGSNIALDLMNCGIPLSTLLPVSGAMVVEGMFLDQIFRSDKYSKLFKMCGLENKEGKLPIVIKKTKKNNQVTLVLYLPPGLSQKQFELKQMELEQHLNAKIEFGFNKNLIVRLIDMNLKSNYSYVFEGCENPLETYCGETHEGKFYLDIFKCPHVIVAGETNSGKSSLLRNLVLSLIISKHDLDLHLIDFQAVELGIFEDCKKVKSYGETPNDFEKLLDEMEEENNRRLKLFRSVKDKIYIQNLAVWNKKFPKKALPFKVVIIDEFSRLSEKEYEDLLERFRTRVAMDRKVGIHYIVAMQRPDVKCISGSIKSNMPVRIAFKTVTEIDSEVILDQAGAERIKQQGRFLIKYCGEFKEVQALYIDNEKVRGFLEKYGAYKTKEELQIEKQEQMKARREQCINPYLKEEMA